MAAFDLSSNEVLSAALGAVIGGLFAVLGVYLAHRSQEKAKRKDDIEAGLKFLAAVREELSANLELYSTSIRPTLLATPVGEPFLYTWPVSEFPFPVYTANCGSLGLVEDAAMRADIVRIYAQTGGFLATFRFNNVLNERYENIEFLSRTSQSPAVISQVQRLRAQLVAYAPHLRERDAAIFDTGQQIIDRIGAALNAGPQRESHR